MDLLVDLFDLLLVIPITNILVGLSRVFGGNFGLAIIVFTIGMRFVTWPLTARQYKQSKAMQELQPRVAEIQKKYKGKDPKKAQQEMMALYKEAGVNPLGCLWPLLVQFPIWIALYQVINFSVGESPESLVTLSQRLYPIDFVHTAVPVDNQFLIWNLGQPDATLILPLIVGLTMYIQQKMITPPRVANPTPQQLQQQQTTQMMMWMMPLMFGFFSLSVPSGLALYWAITNLAGITLQYFYMGRRVQFRDMFSLSPSAAPALTNGKQNQPKAKQAELPAEPAEAEGPAAEPDGEAAVTPGPRRGRRNRHGRRRGKR
jgi:YidC/Oxa1 family membrane protein insertase